MDKEALAKELAEKYLEKCNIPSEVSENPYKIFFIGLVGAGKTTVAKKLRDRLIAMESHLYGLIYAIKLTNLKMLCRMKMSMSESEPCHG